MGWDVVEAMERAWEVVGPRLEREPDELAARLARRRMGIFRRAPRAWCLAVRACDTRITCREFVMRPQRPEWWEGEKLMRCEHEVELDARGLRKLCRPIWVPGPGMTVKDVAELMGMNERVIWAAVRRGLFLVERHKGLGGARGKPVPVIFARRLLDPAGIAMGRINDAGWGTMWRYVSDHIPDGLKQSVKRRPVMRGYGRTRSGGWRWVCPGCGRETRVVYCPMPGPEFPRFAKWREEESADAVARPMMSFACGKCHEVHDYGRLDGKGWNDLVAYLSGGLLYGKEVERPEWWVQKRKRKYAPRPNYPASKRGAAITKMLVETDLSCRQIAMELGLAMGTICGWVGRIYTKHGVHGREELKEKLAREAPERVKATAQAICEEQMEGGGIAAA